MTRLADITSPTELRLLVSFSDLTGFFRICLTEDPEDLFDLISSYYTFVGDIIEPSGGTIVKFIGDAALIVYPEEALEAGVLALRELQRSGDEWLKGRGASSRHIIKAHFGLIWCGPMGTRSEKRFDVLGQTANTAAVLKSNGFAITPQVFRRLGPETRKIFKKHTPPVVYIPTEERHQERPG